MYLSEPANEETFAMLADLLAEGSVVAFTYFGKALLHAQARREQLIRRAVARWGEPWRLASNRSRLPCGLPRGDSLLNTTTRRRRLRRDGCRPTSPRSSKEISGG
jgi:O-methyltransferase involved in polyketide biosynthesis